MIGGAAPPIAPSPPGAGVTGVEAEGAAGADLTVSYIVQGIEDTHEAEEAEADSTGAEEDTTGAEADSTGSDSVGVETVGSAGYSSVVVAEGTTTTSEEEAAGTEAEIADDEAGTDAEGAAEDPDAEGAGAGALPPPE